MNTTQADFYVTGGTLGQDVPSYVPRQADQDLYEGLRQGEFCYVLTSRQMGKSSLMVRAAARLRSDGAAVAVLDLTGIGVNVTAEQWYDGLLMRVGEQLDLEDELEDFWLESDRLSPLNRWMQGVEQVALARHDGLVVIFVDEIDAVRSLPFSADEFFAGIRECYNRRAENSELCRLAFCLLGVATPSDLIQDPHMTPFNIGRRIQLDDFRRDEAEILSDGLGGESDAAGRLLERVLHWTGGHPYLTQRLCKSVARDTNVITPADVDRICHAGFITYPACERDDNLSFVRQRLLHSDGDLAGLLEHYDKVLRRKRVEADETKPLIAKLRLTGIVRAAGSYLEVRNGIYEKVFDRDWVRANMPDAEVRRQRAAFRRGLLRASAVACVVILVLTVSVVFALYQWRQAATARDAEIWHRESANIQRERAETARQQARTAWKEAETAKDDAERARDSASSLRAEAEQERLKAVEAKRQEEKERDEAAKERTRAEQAQRTAEAARDQERVARQQAEKEKRASKEYAQRAEMYAQRAEKTASLFKELLPLLAEHAAEGIQRHAQILTGQGKTREAIKTYHDFCELTLGEKRGFDLRDLLGLDPSEMKLLALDDDPARMQVSVSQLSLLKFVVEPAIELSEEELREQSDTTDKSAVARLHATRARLIVELHSSERPAATRFEAAVLAYDRAIQLDAGQYDFFAGRAGARFRSADRDLSQIRQDLEKAVDLYDDPPKPPTTAEAVTESHLELAALHNAQGNIVERIALQNPGDDAAGLYEDAARAHARARELNPGEASYPLAVARTLRKRARHRRAAAEKQDHLQKALELLDEAASINDELPEIYNERGEVYLALNDAVKARTAFARAAEVSLRPELKQNQYRYLCNLANAYLCEPASDSEFLRALEAADRAITLRPDKAPEGYYYRGRAEWQLNRNSEAIEAFDRVLRFEPEHIGALLARSLIVFDMSPPGPTDEQLRRARLDVETAVQVAGETPATREDQAKAHYVRSVGWLRHHLESRSEQSLLSALDDLVTSVRLVPGYAQRSQQVFSYAAKFAWQDGERRKEFETLRQEFERLTKTASK